VTDLEADLKAAHDRNSELEEQIRDLKAEIVQLRRTASSGASTLPPLEEEKVTIDESIPEASPRALMKALKGSYDDALGDLDKGAAGSRERNVYVSQVDKWANRVNREYRKQIIWAVRVSDATIGPRGADLMVQAVDPETDALLGPEFPVRVTNKTIARRLQELLQARQLIDGKFEMKGALSPEVRMNVNREAAGTFDNPPLIGPFAEFRMTVDVTSIRPFEEVQAEKPNQPAPGNAPAP
jgi:hypothetical protein